MRRIVLLTVTALSMLFISQAHAQTETRLKVKNNKLKEHVKTAPNTTANPTVVTQPVRTTPATSTTVNVNTNPSPRTDTRTSVSERPSGAVSAQHTSSATYRNSTVKHTTRVTHTRRPVHHYTRTTTKTTVSQ